MTLDSVTQDALVELLLSIADDKLMLGHRDSDWTGLAPILEEDIAFSSIAQDEISHAAALYEFIGGLRGVVPDRIAYGREPAEYRCAALVEPSDDFDFAAAIVRQFLCDHFDVLRLQRLAQSSDRQLAALAGRMLAEERMHVDHSDAWLARLAADPAARARVQAALDRAVPLAAALFEPTTNLSKVESAGLYPALSRPIFEVWAEAVTGQAQAAGLRAAPRDYDQKTPGGRSGRHTPAFADLLAEMCQVYRVEPESAW